MIIYCLVVTGAMEFWMTFHWEFHHPNWRSPWFVRGVGYTTNQSISLDRKEAQVQQDIPTLLSSNLVGSIRISQMEVFVVFCFLNGKSMANPIHIMDDGNSEQADNMRLCVCDVFVCSKKLYQFGYVMSLCPQNPKARRPPEKLASMSIIKYKSHNIYIYLFGSPWQSMTFAIYEIFSDPSRAPGPSLKPLEGIIEATALRRSPAWATFPALPRKKSCSFGDLRCHPT